jgi:hypothetical protein
VTIFFEQSTDENSNNDLIEIKDKKLIDEVFLSLNLNLRDNKMIAPYVIGTVVNGGFRRKLRMLKAEFFSLLSIIHSERYVHNENLKDALNVKKGITKITEKS